jgi:SAM-dependent methyltransferase/uncharacterized protein YbaR (Trm112 family)
MNVTASFIELLRCPFCMTGLRTKSVQRHGGDGGIQYGILECSECNFEYPVVDGIPVLMAPHESVDSKFETNALTLLQGPTVSALVSAVKSGEPVRALSLLFNPSKLGGDWFLPLEARALRDSSGRRANPEGDQSGGYGTRLQRAARKLRRKSKKAVARFALPHARMRLADFLNAHAPDLSALDVMDLYYRGYSGAETFNYFAYRFGQPRHLAALSLARLMAGGEGPILDIACGVGHITHFLSGAHSRRTVVGLDRDFVRLWIANRFVAPGGRYVCASADQALPFADSFFDGIFCSDAFHCFLHRAASVREMRRALSPLGVLTLARFGNAAVEPREGYELTVAGYERLFPGIRHAFVGEESLIDAYLSRHGAHIEGSDPLEKLEKQKWLCVVASERPDIFARGQPLPSWPHAVGRLQINPIYKVEKRAANGDLELVFKFPSDWYRFENEAYLRYAPERCTLPAELACALEKREVPPGIDDYVSRFVVIGMPERYCEK